MMTHAEFRQTIVDKESEEAAQLWDAEMRGRPPEEAVAALAKVVTVMSALPKGTRVVTEVAVKP